MFARVSHRPFLVALTAIALAVGVSGCGKDLSKMKDQALALVGKYRPQVEGGLKTVVGLLDQAKTLPTDTPVVGDLVKLLNGQQDNLNKLKGLLDSLPAQAEAAAKAGKEEDLKKLITTVDTEVGGGVTAANTALADAPKALAAAETEVKKAAAEAAGKKLAEAGAPLVQALAKVDTEIAAWQALPPETAGVADAIKAAQALKAEGEAAKATLDAAPAKLAEAANLSAQQAVIDATSQAVAAATKKLEDELAALKAKLGAVPAPTPAPALDFVKALSTGFELKGMTNGVESGLIAFVEDTSKEVDKTTWFNFDRLNFASGKTELDMEASKDQLQNMVEILKAFPNLKLKIGGYTDNDGPADVNTRISLARAQAVTKALAALGVAPDRLEAEGYGPEHPACPANDTPECKAQNRRIAVRVTAK